jgi:hypothetical protein
LATSGSEAFEGPPLRNSSRSRSSKIDAFNSGGAELRRILRRESPRSTVSSPSFISSRGFPAKLVNFLRDQYRRSHLESLAPDGAEGQPPGGRWAELVGVNYRRTIYGFQLDTTEEQDDELIRKYNSSPNQTQFNLVTHNCADFARSLINFYFPKVLGRSVVGDLGVTTPKHIGQLLVRFGERHPELHLSSFVISQVSGSIRRSRPVRGVAESVFRAKKYMLPLLVFHPVVAGCVGTAALSGARFNPARNAMVFDPSGDLGPPLPAAERRMYQNRLQALKRPLGEGNPWNGNTWQRLEADARPRLDGAYKAFRLSISNERTCTFMTLVLGGPTLAQHQLNPCPGNLFLTWL